MFSFFKKSYIDQIEGNDRRRNL